MNLSALLIIDVQKDFTQPDGRLPVEFRQAEELLGNLNRLLEASKPELLLPVYIANEFSRFDPLNLFRNFCALRYSEGSWLDPRLKIASQHYFPKQQGNAFTNRALAPFLRQEGCQHLILAGIQAEACVFDTWKGARKLGFDCTVIRDAVASPTATARREALENFVRQGARLATTDEVLAGR